MSVIAYINYELQTLGKRLANVTGWPVDKAGHFVTGVFVAAVAGGAAALFGASAVDAGIVGLGSATVAGALKEVYDRQYPDRHVVDVWDFAWTTAGGGAGALVVWGLA